MKKYVRKMLGFTLAITLAATTFGACTPKRPGGAPPSSDVQSSSPGTGTAAPEDAFEALPGKMEGNLIVWAREGVEEEFYKKAGEQFAKDTGMTVEVIGFSGTSASDKLALDGPAGNGGDVYMQGGGGSLSKSAEQGLFMPIPEGLFDMDRFVENALPSYLYKGQYYGMPMGSECPALIYNKDLVDTIPATWEEMVDKFGENVDINADKYGFLMDSSNFYFTMALIYGRDGYIFGEKDGALDTTDIGLDKAPSVEVYKMIESYYKDGLMQRNMAYDVMQTKFIEGKAPAVYDGPWAIAGYKEAGMNLGVAPLPAYKDGGVPTTFSGGYGIAVSQFTKNPRAAFQFMDYCLSDEWVMEYYRATNLIPPLKTCVEMDEIKNDAVMNGFAQQMENTVGQPAVPETDMVWDPMVAAGKLIFGESAPVEDTLKQAVALIHEKIALLQE